MTMRTNSPTVLPITRPRSFTLSLPIRPNDFGILLRDYNALRRSRGARRVIRDHSAYRDCSDSLLGGDPGIIAPEVPEVTLGIKA